MELFVQFESINQSIIGNRSNLDAVDNRSVKDMRTRIATVAQFSVIGGLGIIGNLLPIILTAAGRVPRNTVNAMIANLSISEFILCFSFVFGQSFFVLWREYLPIEGCHFLSFLHFTAAFASFMFPPILAVNRYVSLYYNERYKKIYTKRNTRWMLGSCWIFCSIVPMVFMLAKKTGYDDDNDHCCMVVNGDTFWIVAYWLVIIVPLLTFCDGVMIFCNYKIYRKLHTHDVNAKTVVTVVSQNRELLYFLLVDMLFPICFHSVYHISKFAYARRTNEFFKRFFISLYLVNSLLRGVITLIMLRPYRNALKLVLYRLKYGAGGIHNSVHPINTRMPSAYRSGPL